MTDKSLFIISPIGLPDSLIRVRSDRILKYIVMPIASNLGYKVIRADFINEPGLISAQIISQVIESDLMIADLTGNNPNVFYELGIRHAVQKPVILMIEKGGTVPFDIYTQRILYYDLSDLDTVDNCKNELHKQIMMIESGDFIYESPIMDKINITLKEEKHTNDINLIKNNFKKKNEYLTILNNITDVFEKEGVITTTNAKFFGKGGFLIENDLEFEYKDIKYVIELKTSYNISWEQISQFKARLDIMRNKNDIKMRGILILVGSHPSDVVRIYAENNEIDLFWFNDVDQLRGKTGKSNIKYILRALKGVK